MSLARRDWLAVAIGLPGAAAVLAGTWLGAVSIMAGQAAGTAAPSAAAVVGSSFSASASPGSAADLVIDVQGAVKQPGVVLLPAGSRVADALRAAGGYSRDADLNAAAGSLNLAATLTDGAQVYVPVIGVPIEPGGGGTGGGGGSDLVNLNTATPEELEALPGVGPVTVQKIVAARAEQPFVTLEELVERDVLDRGQLEDVRDLVTL
jgi:competence protein ComEA